MIGGLSILPYLLIPLAYLSRFVDFDVDALAWFMGASVAMSLVGAFMLLAMIPAAFLWLRWSGGGPDAAKTFLKQGLLRYAPLFIAAQLEIYVGLKTDHEGSLPFFFGAIVLTYAWYLYRRDRGAPILPRIRGLDSIRFPF